MNGSKQKLIIIGAGGHAKVVLATALAQEISVLGLLDDNPQVIGREVLSHPVLGAVAPNLFENHDLILAIGSNQLRKKLAQQFAQASFQKLVHPQAIVHDSVEIGAGSVVFAGSVIQPDVKIGKHCIINTGVTIDHDCTIDDYVHLAPSVHLAGGVHIHEGTFLGIGSVVIPQIKIGEWTTVAAGSVVVKTIDAHKIVMGVPAKERMDQCKPQNIN